MQACIGKVKKLAKLSTDSKTEIEAFEARLAEAAAERRAEEDAAQAAEVHAAAIASEPAGEQGAASGSPAGTGDARVDAGCDGQAEGRGCPDEVAFRPGLPNLCGRCLTAPAGSSWHLASPMRAVLAAQQPGWHRVAMDVPVGIPNAGRYGDVELGSAATLCCPICRESVRKGRLGCRPCAATHQSLQPGWAPLRNDPAGGHQPPCWRGSLTASNSKRWRQQCRGSRQRHPISCSRGRQCQAGARAGGGRPIIQSICWWPAPRQQHCLDTHGEG